MTTEETPKIRVTGAGAVTSLGFDLTSTAAAIDAGIDCFSETAFVHSNGQPIIGAAVPSDDSFDFRAGPERAGALLAMAIEEAIINADVELSLVDEVQLFCILPEFNPDDALLPFAIRRLKEIGIDLEDRTQFAVGGAVAMGRILHGVHRWISGNKKRVAVIAAFDSWLNVAMINEGLRQERFLTGERSDGMIPGEAASAIVLESSSGRLPIGPWLEVSGIGMEDESVSLRTDRPGTGVGLGKAIRKAIGDANIDASEMHLRLANVTGEEYFFTESAYAWTRVLRKVLPETYRYQIIDSSIGTVGSAFGPLCLGYALASCQSAKENQNVLFQISSAGPHRCAIVGKVVVTETGAA
jgi:3-oxoacyl-[acyl-carrier-protein] synthase-1